MKTLFTTLFCFFTIISLSAQGINWIHGTENYNDGANIVATTPGEWGISGKSASAGGFGSTYPFVGSYSNNQWTDFNITELVNYQGEMSNISDITYDPSLQQFYFVLGQDVCDVTLPNFLVSTGQAGTWEKQISGDFSSSYPLCAVPGNGVIWGIESGQWLRWQRSVDDETDFSSVLTGESLNDLQFWRSGTFLAQTEANLHAYIFDVSGAVLDNSYPSTTSILAFSVIDGDRLVVVEEDRVTLLDSELNVLMDISPEGMGTPHLTTDASGVYLLRELTSDGTQAFFLDHTLNEIGRTAVEIPGYEIGDIAAQGGRIAIIGAQQFAPLFWAFEPINSQLFLRTYTISGPDLDQQHDLAVEAFTFDNVHFYTPDGWWCNNAEIDNLLVTVRNNGDTPINDVLLKFDTDICHGICDGYMTKTQLHSGLDLQPGQSILLPFENFNLYGLMQADELELCINVTAPDHPMEITLENNSSCKTIMVVDTEESLVEESTLHVFPNPVTQMLRIEIPPQTQSIQIYDGLGKLVLQENTKDSQGRHELDVSDLPSGIYFLRTSGGQAIYTGSFIRQ